MIAFFKPCQVLGCVHGHILQTGARRGSIGEEQRGENLGGRVLGFGFWAAPPKSKPTRVTGKCQRVVKKITTVIIPSNEGGLIVRVRN